MKTRIIAAVVLLPLLLLVVLAAPKFLTAILFGAMAAIGAYELLNGTGLVKNVRLCVYSMVMAFWSVLWCGLGIGYVWLLLGALIFWIALFAETMASGMKLTFDKIALCLAAGIVVPLLFGSVVRIHYGEYGRFFVLVPFAMAFLSDTGAYCAGLNFGKHKLAPVLSPKKSIEGSIGGIAGSALVGALFGYFVVEQVISTQQVTWIFALIGACGSVVSQIGDLAASAIKRNYDIKDYGKLIPGHGGIMDRFDSVLVTAPIIYFMFSLLV